MKCVNTFGTGRHKRQADITLLFQYICTFICIYKSCVLQSEDKLKVTSVHILINHIVNCCKWVTPFVISILFFFITKMCCCPFNAVHCAERLTSLSTYLCTAVFFSVSVFTN